MSRRTMTMKLQELADTPRAWDRRGSIVPMLREIAREPRTSSALRHEIRSVVAILNSAEWLAMLVEDAHQQGEQVTGAEWHLVSLLERARSRLSSPKPHRGTP